MAKKNKLMVGSKKQLEALKAKYGHSINHVDVTLPMTYNEVLSYFGPPCEEYEPLCGCCRAWVEWQTSGQRVTITLERDEVIKMIY